MEIGVFCDAVDGQVMLTGVMRTTQVLERMRGLLGRPAPDSGLWIVPCNSVHSAFMRYPIDAVFIDRSLRIVRVVDGLRPWRIAAALTAHSTLELAAGRAAALGLVPGRRLSWRAKG